MMRRGWLWFGAGVGLIALVAGFAWREREARWYRAELDQAKREMTEGLFNTARERLAVLAMRWPGQGEVDYHLGLCERSRGRLDAASEAWKRVAPGSPQAGWAALEWARMELKRGRMADTEDLLVRAVSRPGSHAVEARWELVRLLRLQGRFDEARHRFQEGFAALPDPVRGLKDLYLLDIDPFPLEGVRLFL